MKSGVYQNYVMGIHVQMKHRYTAGFVSTGANAWINRACLILSWPRKIFFSMPVYSRTTLVSSAPLKIFTGACLVCSYCACAKKAAAVVDGSRAPAPAPVDPS